MRVLVISQHFWPETFRINEVVESLRACDVHVEVLAGQPNYPKGEIYEGYSSFGFGSERHSSGYVIHRVPVVSRGKGGGLRRLANYGSFVLSGCLLAPWLLRGKRYDVIFVYAISPILQGLPAALLKLFKRSALVIWVQDLWPDSLESTGYVRNRTALALVGSLTRFIYRRADLLLGQSNGFVHRIREMAGADIQVEYHPNPGDISLIDAVDHAEPPFEFRKGHFNVVFAGNFGAAQSLETIVAAAQQIHDPSIRIVMVGDGSRATWLRHEIERLSISNIEVAGRFSGEAMPAIFQQASALLVTLGQAANLSLTVPSKIPTYLAAGRPIIGCLNGEGADVIKAANAGLVVPAGDASALASAIVRMRNMPEKQVDEMAEAGRSYFERFLAPQPLAQTLVRHLHDACIARRCKARKRLSETERP